MDFKILISGSRYGCDPKIISDMIHYVLITYPNKNYILIHGNAKGVDTMAKNYCQQMGWSCIRFEPDWKKHGKSAGPLRNQTMVNENPDIGLFIPSIDSKGTLDCYNRFLKLNKPGIFYDPINKELFTFNI
jgi:hypothetical protein